MNKKIILINPYPYQRIEKDDRPNHPHLGLAYLGACLLKNEIDCQIIDAKLERIKLKEIIRRISDYRPALVGITALTHEIEVANEIGLNLKSLFPNLYIIIGGVHATSLPIETLKEFSSFDFLIDGEGEYALPELINKLESKEKNIKGVLCREDDKIINLGKKELIKNLDEIPFPEWKLFRKAKWYPLLTVRGCPFKCSFCSRPYGEVIRERSVENVIEEQQKIIKDFQARFVRFYDETFGLNKGRAFKMLDTMIKNKINKKVKWFALTRIDVVDFELLRKMREAGCYMVGFGLETGNGKIAEIINKKIDFSRAKELFSYSKKLGLMTQAYFIIGHPNETRATISQTINLAVKVNADLTSFGIMVPYPKTEIYEMAKSGKYRYRLLSKKWSDYNKQIGNALELENLSRRELEKFQLRGIIKVYFSNWRLLDFFKFLIEYRREGIAYIKNYIKRSLSFKKVRR